TRPMVEDLRAQLGRLVRPGFVAGTGYDRLPHLRRYLAAMVERLEKGQLDVRRDSERMAEVHQVEQELTDFLAGLPEHRRTDPDAVEIRWQVEELRVSLFAQRLGTAQPVSAKRIYAAMDRV